MIRQSSLHHTLALLSLTALSVASVSAQTTTWNGVGNWNQIAAWDNGIPTGSTDVIVTKSSGGNQALNPNAGNSFRNLYVSNANTALGYIRINIVANTTVTGNSFSLSSTNLGQSSLSLLANSTLTLQEGLSLVSNSNANDAVSLTLEEGSTINAPGGISFGSNANTASAPLNAYLTHGNIGAGATINADLTFNNGSRYWVSNNGGSAGTFAINGSVTLQAGTYTGAKADFNVGRASTTDDGVTVKIRDSLSVTDGASVTIQKGKILEAGSASFTAGGRLTMTGYSGAAGSAVFRVANNLTINGGSISSPSGTGNAGTFEIEVGGDFVLGTGSTINLSNAALGTTTLKLKGDLDLRATGLAASTNLNLLRVVLEGGSSAQKLEAAVSNSTNTFTLHTLTFSADTDEVILINDYLNVAADEYFKTLSLVNDGNTILNLNGLDFYVGNTLLTEGVYTTYGGTLTVIPEPSTLLLFAGTVGGFLILRRRKLL